MSLLYLVKYLCSTNLHEMTVLSSIFKNTQTLSLKMIFFAVFRRVIWLLTPCLNR